MKKILFDEFDRKAMRENNSLYATGLKLHIERMKLERAFIKSHIGRIIMRLFDWIERLLSKTNNAKQ